MGIAATSWNSRMEKAACPAPVPIRLRCCITCKAIAVEDKARPSAPTTAQRQGTPAATPAIANRGRAAQHLGRAPAEDGPPEGPQTLRLQLQADEEEHQHHAELGEMQHRLWVAHKAQGLRPQQEAGGQVADDGAEPQGLRQRHDEDGGAEESQAGQQPVAAVVHARLRGGRSLRGRAQSGPAPALSPGHSG